MILKPDPGNAQELYLGSLEALGIDTKVRRGDGVEGWRWGRRWGQSRGMLEGPE